MVNSFDLFVIQKRHPCQRQEYEFHVNLLNLSSRVQRCVYSISWSLMTCLLGFFTSESSSVLSPHTLPSLEPAKNSAKMSPLHHKVSKENKVKNKTNSDYPFWQIPHLWGILPDRLCYFFENYRISAMQCLFGVALVPLWVVIPYLWKHSSSLGICVRWCPQVNHDCSKAIKCCSGVPSHLTLSQHFHLAHCLPLQPKKFQR